MCRLTRSRRSPTEARSTHLGRERCESGSGRGCTPRRRSSTSSGTSSRCGPRSGSPGRCSPLFPTTTWKWSSRGPGVRRTASRSAPDRPHQQALIGAAASTAASRLPRTSTDVPRRIGPCFPFFGQPPVFGRNPARSRLETAAHVQLSAVRPSDCPLSAAHMGVCGPPAADREVREAPGMASRGGRTPRKEPQAPRGGPPQGAENRQRRSMVEKPGTGTTSANVLRWRLPSRSVRPKTGRASRQKPASPP